LKDKPNHLINETSPYLLQHAHNPVDWYPWSDEALDRARNEDKPIILSIGYSSCHWCHVMERESFEHEGIAQLMNAYFISIKVDREERPDIDQIYMDAVQAMGVNGGWPLNVFLTPDQKPFYGGTYFPAAGWAKMLSNINQAYRDQRDQLENSANQFISHMSLPETARMGLTGEGEEFDMIHLDQAFQQFFAKFDTEKGGVKKAPKFPMPNNWLFALRYHHLTGNHYALEQVKLTLKQIAYGGIYDQIGGGFARYSVDDRWFAPHFEKMLYDNGQLVSLYSETFRLTQEPLYKEVVYETITWLEREMLSPEGGFYSALDADSEGVEGKFYSWTEEELEDLCGDETPVISAYFNTTTAGNWEDGRNILFRKIDDNLLAKNLGLSEDILKLKVLEFKKAALNKRDERIRPGLDDKILTSWNAIMLKGLIDAYRAFGDDHFLELALKNAEFIDGKLKDGDKLFRTYKNGEAKLQGYLEDYAHLSDAFLHLYQVTFNEHWLSKSVDITQFAVDHFLDNEDHLFFFTGDHSEQLVARKKELFDNVIPASNSVMANNLFLLGKLTDKNEFMELSVAMLSRISKLIGKDVSYLSNWAILMSYNVKPFSEIVITGEEMISFGKELWLNYKPNVVVLGTEDKSTLALLEGREAKPGQMLVYVCYNKTCQLPVASVTDALSQLK